LVGFGQQGSPRPTRLDELRALGKMNYSFFLQTCFLGFQIFFMFRSKHIFVFGRVRKVNPLCSAFTVFSDSVIGWVTKNTKKCDSITFLLDFINFGWPKPTNGVTVLHVGWNLKEYF